MGYAFPKANAVAFSEDGCKKTQNWSVLLFQIKKQDDRKRKKGKAADDKLVGSKRMKEDEQFFNTRGTVESQKPDR